MHSLEKSGGISRVHFKVLMMAVAFTGPIQAETGAPHMLAAFSPFAGRPRPMECLAEETPNLRIGPRAELLSEIVELFEAEFKRARTQASPTLPDDQVAQELLNSNPAVLRLLMRHNLSLKETSELLKRWNDKYLHGAIKLPAEKTGYRSWLGKAFSSLYEMPNLDDRGHRFEGAIAQSQAELNALIEQGIVSGKPDLAAISDRMAKLKGLRDARDEWQAAQIGRSPVTKTVSDYLRRR